MINKQGTEMRKVVQLANRLGELTDQIVFVGGCTAGLLVPDTTATGARTDVVEVSSRMDYNRFTEELHSHGFKQDTNDEAPLRRWSADEPALDFVPAPASVPGTTGHWYVPAMEHAVAIPLEKGIAIRHVSAPYFLAIKIDTFGRRGREDYAASRDMQEMVAVLAGRPGILDEIEASPADLRRYLAERFRGLLETEAFIASLPVHLTADKSGLDRLTKRMKAIANLSEH